MSGTNDAAPRRERMTAPKLRAKKASGEKITMITAYDATFARLFDEAGTDALLIGDSLGMVVQGLESTLPVTLDDIVYHSRAVARGARFAHLVADMPFMSYQVSIEDAVRNAGRLLAEGQAHAVKLEGGEELAETIQRIVRAGIPVLGHVGLTPQAVHQLGGFRVQGRTRSQADAIVADAVAVADAGAYAIVLEGIPSDLAATITERVDVPTIGIGAGGACDGQVLVGYDLLGLGRGPSPKFVKHFEELGDRVVAAARAFADAVRAGEFPTAEHAYGNVRADDKHLTLVASGGSRVGYGPQG